MRPANQVAPEPRLPQGEVMNLTVELLKWLRWLAAFGFTGRAAELESVSSPSKAAPGPVCDKSDARRRAQRMAFGAVDGMHPGPDKERLLRLLASPTPANAPPASVWADDLQSEDMYSTADRDRMRETWEEYLARAPQMQREFNVCAQSTPWMDAPKCPWCSTSAPKCVGVDFTCLDCEKPYRVERDDSGPGFRWRTHGVMR